MMDLTVVIANPTFEFLRVVSAYNDKDRSPTRIKGDEEITVQFKINPPLKRKLF